jgi:hypothetical protein
VPVFQRLRENWIRPALFFGNNPISLLGGAITTASALTLIGFWIVAFFGHGGSGNPYVGIIFDLCLPALFVLGLLLIPIGNVVSKKTPQSRWSASRNISASRSERPTFPAWNRHCAHRYLYQLHHRGYRKLPIRGVYGYAQFLRAIMPCHEARMDRLSGFFASECALYKMPYRRGYTRLRARKGERNQTTV